jgi:hypothetical protein
MILFGLNSSASVHSGALDYFLATAAVCQKLAGPYLDVFLAAAWSDVGDYAASKAAALCQWNDVAPIPRKFHHLVVISDLHASRTSLLSMSSTYTTAGVALRVKVGPKARAVSYLSPTRTRPGGTVASVYKAWCPVRKHQHLLSILPPHSPSHVEPQEVCRLRRHWRPRLLRLQVPRQGGLPCRRHHPQPRRRESQM